MVQIIGVGIEHIRSSLKKHGDLGVVAETIRSRQKILSAPKPLTISVVFSKLKDIASMSGNSVSLFVRFLLAIIIYTYTMPHNVCVLFIVSVVYLVLRWWHSAIGRMLAATHAPPHVVRVSIPRLATDVTPPHSKSAIRLTGKEGSFFWGGV
ncbi:unnamed protein product [Trichobilharzia regenti]|nr:unnamed protein product [Trichobilharzia regenti]